jgi:hypothetical protein
MGETPPIKAERPEPFENQHIYEDLNESFSARSGGSQQLDILPSPNSKWTPNFSAQILARPEILLGRRDFIFYDFMILLILLLLPPPGESCWST